MHRNEHESIEIKTIPTYDQSNHSTLNLPNEIHVLNLDQRESERILHQGSLEDEEDELENEGMNNKILSDLDLKEVYLKLVFEPFKFSKQNIIRSLGILGIPSNENISQNKTIDEIKEILIKSIERAVQSHPNYVNCSEEDFLSLNSKCWSKYYTMLKQYDYDSRMPLGVYVDPHNESVILLIRKV